MEKKPRISVVMPVYNAEKYLDESISSILSQTYSDFEFLIFNDGSTDKSKEIIERYASKDSRIRFIDQQTNTGYVPLLNRGISMAQGEFIARMDADDVSLPTRFEKQIEYMDNHPNVVILGTSCKAIKNDEIHDGWILNASVEETRVHFLFTNYIIHPSVLMRKKSLDENPYREECMPAEDFDLWSRALDTGDIVSLSEPLIKYRIHATSTSSANKTKSYKIASEILASQLRKLGINPTEAEIELHHSTSDFVLENVTLNEISAWYKRIWDANRFSKKYVPHILLSTILGRWLIIYKKIKWQPKKVSIFLNLCFSLLKTLSVFEMYRLLNLSLKRIIRYTLS